MPSRFTTNLMHAGITTQREQMVGADTPMMIQDFRKLFDGLPPINVEVEDIPQDVLQWVLRVRLHVSHEVDQF